MTPPSALTSPHPILLQFYILQDSAKADSSTWSGLIHLTFVNDEGEEVTRSVPTNGTAEYAALSANTVTLYYCQRLPQGKNSCAELTPYVPTVNNTCKRSTVYDLIMQLGLQILYENYQHYGILCS